MSKGGWYTQAEIERERSGARIEGFVIGLFAGAALLLIGIVAGMQLLPVLLK